MKEQQPTSENNKVPIVEKTEAKRLTKLRRLRNYISICLLLQFCVLAHVVFWEKASLYSTCTAMFGVGTSTTVLLVVNKMILK